MTMEPSDVPVEEYDAGELGFGPEPQCTGGGVHPAQVAAYHGLAKRRVDHRLCRGRGHLIAVVGVVVVSPPWRGRCLHAVIVERRSQVHSFVVCA